MGRPRTKCLIPAAIKTYDDVETLRANAKEGCTVKDAVTRGLNFQRQGHSVFARHRVTHKITKERLSRTWTMPPRVEFIELARMAGSPTAFAEGCIKAQEFLDQVRSEALRERIRAKAGVAVQLQTHSVASHNRAAPTTGGPTMLAAVQDYLRLKGPSLAASTLREYEGMIERLLKTHPMAAQLVRDVSFRDVQELMLENAGTPSQANRLRSLLSGTFNHAIQQGWREGNPVQGVARFTENERERILTKPEQEQFEAVLDAELAKPDGSLWAGVFRLQLLQGARVDEVKSMEWSEVTDLDGDDPLWTLPKRRSKSRKTIRRALDSSSVALLKQLRQRTGNSKFVFPSAASNSGHLEEPKKAFAQFRKAAGIAEKDANGEKLTPHSLRHTAATRIKNEAGIYAAKEQLGHADIGTTQRYAKADLEAQRAVMERVNRRKA